MSELPTKKRRRSGALTAAMLALAIGGGGAAFVSTQDLMAQTALTPPTAQAPGGGLPISFADVVERVGPAVVNVQVQKNVETSRGGVDGLPEGAREFFKHFFGDQFSERFGQDEDARPTPQRQRRMMGVGSGFVISADGFVVTNNHVVEGADEVTVTFQDQRELKAKVVGTDPKTDLALLKVSSDKDLPYVAWGASHVSRVGDWIISVGNPFGLGHSVTTGIISARGRTIGAGPYDVFLQISAPINRGNSGGPTFNIDGEVIGVNTAIFSPSGGSVGIGFAIPSDMAQRVVAQLKDQGFVERGWLGVMIQNVNEDIASSVGLDKAEGAIVAQVTPDSPAAKAGLRQGDVILAVNGEKVDRMRELPRIVADLKPGADAKLTVLRERSRRDVNVRIAKMPDDPQMAAVQTSPGSGDAASSETALGLKLARLDDGTRKRFGIEDGVEGVVIADVAADSPVAESGVSRGDVIVSVDQKAVSSPSQVVSQVEAARKDKRRAVLLLINTNGQERFVALPLNKA